MNNGLKLFYICFKYICFSQSKWLDAQYKEFLINPLSDKYNTLKDKAGIFNILIVINKSHK